VNRITIEAEFGDRKDLLKIMDRLKTVLSEAQTSPGEDQVLSISGRVYDTNLLHSMIYQVELEYATK
jgi:hypothetical protein